MKYSVELPGPVIVNRPVHSMAVIVVSLFAFHFARLAGFSLAAVLGAGTVALCTAATLGLRRIVSLDRSAQNMTRTVTLFSFPLHQRQIALPGMSWAGVRSDLPDLVVEVGTASDEAVEVLRFRNAFGGRESEAISACSRLAAALRIEDRGFAG